MKKHLGYLIIIILGVAALIAIMNRNESLDNNVAKDDSNVIELFS